MIVLIVAFRSWRREERRCLNQPEKRPKRSVTSSNGAMRGGGAGRWEALVREVRRRINQLEERQEKQYGRCKLVA